MYLTEMDCACASMVPKDHGPAAY